MVGGPVAASSLGQARPLPVGGAACAADHDRDKAASAASRMRCMTPTPNVEETGPAALPAPPGPALLGRFEGEDPDDDALRHVGVIADVELRQRVLDALGIDPPTRLD